MEYNIENEEGILIQGKGNYCSKLKKGKLKTKKLFKITILDEQEPSVQSAERTKARKNPKEQYLKVVTFSDASFSKRRIYLYDHAA